MVGILIIIFHQKPKFELFEIYLKVLIFAYQYPSYVLLNNEIVCRRKCELLKEKAEKEAERRLKKFEERSKKEREKQKRQIKKMEKEFEAKPEIIVNGSLSRL